MPEMNRNELDRVIRAGEVGGAYYIYGTDSYTIGQMKNALVRSVVDESAEALNLHRFEGKDSTDAMIQACEALPVFAPQMCVTVCDFDLDTVKPGDKNMKELYAEIEALPDTTVLVFYTLNADICGGKKAPTAKNKKLTDLIKKCGTLVRIDIPTPAEGAREIVAMFAAQGSSIDKAGAQELFARTGDLAGAATEVGKLAAYALGRQVTREDVMLLTPERDDTKVYALADAVAAHDLDRAVAIYDRLIDNRMDPIYLLYTVTGGMNDIYRARLAIDSGRSTEDTVNDFGYPKNMSFRVTNAFRSASRTNTGYMRRCMEILCGADTDIKSGVGKPETIVETAIIKMLT